MLKLLEALVYFSAFFQWIWFSVLAADIPVIISTADAIYYCIFVLAMICMSIILYKRRITHSIIGFAIQFIYLSFVLFVWLMQTFYGFQLTNLKVSICEIFSLIFVVTLFVVYVMNLYYLIKNNKQRDKLQKD